MSLRNILFIFNISEIQLTFELKAILTKGIKVVVSTKWYTFRQSGKEQREPMLNKSLRTTELLKRP